MVKPRMTPKGVLPSRDGEDLGSWTQPPCRLVRPLTAQRDSETKPVPREGPEGWTETTREG